VESALNCQATSPASAHGCWQFMPVTAKDHALVISALVDQRRDLLRSTRAGLGYLSALQQQTGDWFLAMGAYNWGIGRVLRLRDRALAKGASADFLALMQGMPSETRNYVPQVEALKRLILEAQPDELPDADATPGLNPVPLTQYIDVVLAARLSGVSASDLLRMNPAVHGPLILAAAVPELLLPAEAAERLRVGMQTHVGPMSSWQLMRMDRARTVIDIARMRGVPAQMIREVNRIPVGMKPAAGSTLLLPSDANGGTGRISPVEVEAARRGFVPEVVPVWLNARRQDTLATIARRLQLSTAQLVSWNPTLTKSGRLRPGQRVKVLVAPTNSRGVEVEMRRDLR
jgi:membrane-bound lytic murein transglycosylase D